MIKLFSNNIKLLPATFLVKNKQTNPNKKRTDLQDLVLLRFIDFAGQATVGDCIVDDWLVGLGAGLLE